MPILLAKILAGTAARPPSLTTPYWIPLYTVSSDAQQMTYVSMSNDQGRHLRALDRECAAGRKLPEAAAGRGLDPPHNRVGLCRSEPGEPLRRLQFFDRYGATEPSIVCGPDFTNAAFADLLDQHVRSQFLVRVPRRHGPLFDTLTRIPNSLQFPHEDHLPNVVRIVRDDMGDQRS